MHHILQDDGQGIGGHLAGQEVRAEQPVKAGDTREVKLEVQQLGRGERYHHSVFSIGFWGFW